MTISDLDLEFETNLAFYRWQLNGRTKNDNYFTHQAQKMHALKVLSGAQDLISAVHTVSAKLQSKEAQFHVSYGLGRRTRAIWYAFRELHLLIPPDRTNPLPMDDVHRSSGLLNSIYINVRGALDNFAWCFRHP